MAVTIDEMHVEVRDQAAPATAPSAGTDPRKDIDLREAMAEMHERRLRLKAD